MAGPWTWYWVELVTIRWYQQRKVRVEAVIETHSRRQIASIFYKIYPLFLLNVLSRKWNVLWSDLGYYLKYYYHYYKTNHIFVSCSGCTSSSLTGSTCKENQGNKSLNFRVQNQKIGAKTRKQGKNLISLSAAPPVWHGIMAKLLVTVTIKLSNIVHCSITLHSSLQQLCCKEADNGQWEAEKWQVVLHQLHSPGTWQLFM